MPGRNAGLGGNVQPVRVLPTPHGGNGRLPAGGLTGSGDGERICLPAGRAFHRLDAATAAGHDLHVNSGYRTYAEQAALYQGYQNGRASWPRRGATARTSWACPLTSR